ncbi:STAND family AAA ATPase [Geminicoccus flavidas]|uniref:STAND family AAA ATPase n=1 Tax=Geminicoccus flavidas TaxID=2506407 RepID=UPI001357B0F2|nr:hypothetical protein [Geminicoccus flavidas]
MFYKVMQPLLEITQCHESRVIVTPGNHDAHRSCMVKEKYRFDGLLNSINNRNALNAIYLSGQLRDVIKSKFVGYFQMRDLLVRPNVALEDEIISVYAYNDLGISFVELNSAWMTYCGMDGIRDERRLAIPEAAVNRALAAVPSGHASILVTHHPANWLMEHNESDLRDSIDGKISMMLFGHMHESRPSHAGTFKGSCFINQGGALYAGRESYIGYSVIRFHPTLGHVEAKYRSYFDHRREFDAAIDLVDQGAIYSSDQSREYFRSAACEVSLEECRRWVGAEVKNRFEEEFNEGLTERPVCDIFVPPPLLKIMPLEYKEDPIIAEKEEERISYNDVVSKKINYIISGSPEFGKTTLLQQLALSIIAACDDEQVLPVVVNFSHIKRRPNSIEGLIREALPEFPNEVKLRNIIQSGLLVLLVDDVIFDDVVRFGVLRDFINNYSNNRYVISTLAGRNDWYRMPVDIGVTVRFERLGIDSFRRRDVRTLVEKWDCNQRLDQNKILERLIKEMKGINVPITAVNGTILLSIYENNSDFTPINRAVLIEQFVELLLEKHKPEQIERRSFDFTNRMHLLSSIVEFMCNNNSYVLRGSEIHDLIDGYMNRYGFAYKPEAILSEFIQARILVRRDGDEVCFRYRAFLEFFIARRMRDSVSFRQWVLNEDRYMSFVNEIQYYAGIVREDDQLINMIGERFDKIRNELFVELGHKPDLHAIDKFELPARDDTSEALLESVERQINAPPLDQNELDEILEADLPKDVEGRQEVFRPDPSDNAGKWFTCLTIYSSVLRNSELVGDDCKRYHLAKVLEGWAELLVASLWAVPALARTRMMRVNGVQYRVVAPAHFSEGQVARTIYCDFPNAISKLLWQSVGTEKLERQLTEPRLSESGEAKLVQFFRHALCMDLRLGAWASRFEGFCRDIQSHRYLLEASIWKANEVYSLGVLADSSRIRLRNAIAGGIGMLRSGGSREKQQMIVAKQVHRLTVRDLVRRLRVRDEHQG